MYVIGIKKRKARFSKQIVHILWFTIGDQERQLKYLFSYDQRVRELKFEFFS